MIIKSNKKRGSMMIEISVAVFMILVCFFCYENAKRILLVTNEKRIEKHNKQVSIDALSKEIEYNVSYSEIKSKLENKDLNFKYSDNFIDDIEKYNINNLSITDNKDSKRIQVKADTISEVYIKIEVSLICDDEVINKNIIKYPWMDYV